MVRIVPTPATAAPVMTPPAAPTTALEDPCCMGGLVSDATDLLLNLSILDANPRNDMPSPLRLEAAEALLNRRGVEPAASFPSTLHEEILLPLPVLA